MKRLVSIFLCLMMVWQAGAGVALAEDVYFYHTDSVGTPLAMSNASGQKVWEADYKPFGEEYSVSATEENDRRFVGKEKDEETGLNYFGARYLSAGTGRFLAPDSVRAVDAYSGKINVSLLAEPQRLNAYAYSLNNPHRYVDPDGEFAIVLVYGLLAAAAVTWAVIPYENKKQMGESLERGIDKIKNIHLNENSNNDTDVVNSPPVPGAKPGRKTKGRSEQWEKPGNNDTANEDFDGEKPSNVKPLPGGGRIGDLPDGSKILVRPNSSDGRPTLEIQTGKKRIKTRYGN